MHWGNLKTGVFNTVEAKTIHGLTVLYVQFICWLET